MNSELFKARCRINNNAIVLLILIGGLSVYCAMLVAVGEDNSLYRLTGYIWAFVLPIIACIQLRSMVATNRIKLVIAAGYGARIILSVLQENNFGGILERISSSDQYMFWSRDRNATRTLW